MYHTPPSTSIWSVQNPEQFHSHLFGALVPWPISWEWVVGTWLAVFWPVTHIFDLVIEKNPYPTEICILENAKKSEHKTRQYPEIQPYDFFIQYLVQPIHKKCKSLALTSLFSSQQLKPCHDSDTQARADICQRCCAHKRKTSLFSVQQFIYITKSVTLVLSVFCRRRYHRAINIEDQFMFIILLTAK